MPLDLEAALRDLASTVHDDPRRLTLVHQRAQHLRRRRQATGAGAAAAILVAAGVAVEALTAGGGGGRPIAVLAAGGGPASGPAGSSASSAGSSASGSSAGSRSGATTPGASCDTAPPTTAVGVGPAVGQVFTGGGQIVGQPTAEAVTIDVDGGPDAGQRVTLTVGPSSQVSQGNPDGIETATTADHLSGGAAVKFSATRTGASTYLLDDMHAAPAGPKSTAVKEATPPPPPAVGSAFKAAGRVVSVTASTLTITASAGDLTGTVTIQAPCSPLSLQPGSLVVVAGTRTGPDTYQGTVVQAQQSGQ